MVAVLFTIFRKNHTDIQSYFLTYVIHFQVYAEMRLVKDSIMYYIIYSIYYYSIMFSIMSRQRNQSVNQYQKDVKKLSNHNNLLTINKL